MIVENETVCGYRWKKWTQQTEFEPWTILFVFYIILIPLGKAWIRLSSLLAMDK